MPDNSSKPSVIWNKNYIILLLVNLISAIGFNMVYTMIVDYTVNVA